MSKINQKIFLEAKATSLELATRRLFLKDCFLGMGGMAMGSFLSGCDFRGTNENTSTNFHAPRPPAWREHFVSGSSTLPREKNPS